MTITSGNRRHTDPWGKRRHPHKYDPATLHDMLLEDIERNRPLGGPGERGMFFLIHACEKIAGHRRTTVDGYFEQLLAEGAAKTGRETLPLG